MGLIGKTKVEEQKLFLSGNQIYYDFQQDFMADMDISYEGGLYT